MATVTENLTDSNSFTITIASLGSASAQQSTAVDNSSNLDLDALVFVKLKSGATGTSATGYVEVRVVASVDGGTTYTENAGASDAAITLTAPPNAPLIGICNMVANATTYYAGPFSVAAAFGGTLPSHWAIVLNNQSGHALDTTAGNHFAKYSRVRATIV